jgi:hypothetical protein
MNEQLTKQLSTYKRTLENRKVQSTIYTILILVTIFLFDLYGIYTLIKVTKNRHTTLQKLDKLNNDLEYKRDRTDILKKKLEESQLYLDMLENVVPKKPLVENYMVDLVGIAAKHGFKQERLQKRRTVDNYVEVRVFLKGQRDQFVPFIQSLEKTDRLSVINRLYYSLEEETVNVELAIKIYYLER